MGCVGPRGLESLGDGLVPLHQQDPSTISTIFPHSLRVYNIPVDPPAKRQNKMLDVNDFIVERGGNPELIRESQRRRFASVEVVDEVIALFEDHRRSVYQMSPKLALYDFLPVTDRIFQQLSTARPRSKRKSTRFRSKLVRRRRYAVELKKKKKKRQSQDIGSEQQANIKCRPRRMPPNF